jgi:hypothetical protein
MARHVGAVVCAAGGWGVGHYVGAAAGLQCGVRRWSETGALVMTSDVLCSADTRDHNADTRDHNALTS